MNHHALALLILLAVAPGAAADGKVSEFEVKTLTPAARLRLPRLRVPVGPDRPLSIRGRREPVRFAIEDGVLRADATSAEGFETAIEPRRTVAVELDPVPGEEEPPLRRFTFVPGDPEAAEPPWSVVALDVLAGTIGESVMALDYDADGTYFTPYADILVRAKWSEPHPVCRTVVIGRRVFRVEYDEAGRRATWEPDDEFATNDVFPSWAGVAKGLAHLNLVRGGMNLPPVSLNREASADTMLHVKYLGRNGGNGHLEEEGKPGYTRKGMAAGLNALGSLDLGGVPATIDGHLTSLLHRMELIDPTVTQIGIAVGSSRVWIHTECGKRRKWHGQGPVIFPGPNGAWNIGTYGGENPDPRPKGENKTSGLPVTVAWYGDEEIHEVRVSLRGSRGRIRCWKNDSESRDLRTNHPALRAVLMPQTSLTGKHVLSLSWDQGGRRRSLEYRFKIGRWK